MNRSYDNLKSLTYYNSYIPYVSFIFYENGNIKKKINFNSLGEKHGYFYKYRRNGTLLLKEHYFKNKKNGKSFYYFPDGKNIYKEISYKNGLKDGPYFIYHKNSEIVYQCNFYQNIPHGIYLKYKKKMEIKGFYYFGIKTYHIFSINKKIWKIRFIYFGRSYGIWSNILKEMKLKQILF